MQIPFVILIILLNFATLNAELKYVWQPSMFRSFVRQQKQSPPQTCSRHRTFSSSLSSTFPLIQNKCTRMHGPEWASTFSTRLNRARIRLCVTCGRLLRSLCAFCRVRSVIDNIRTFDLFADSFSKLIAHSLFHVEIVPRATNIVLYRYGAVAQTEIEINFVARIDFRHLQMTYPKHISLSAWFPLFCMQHISDYGGSMRALTRRMSTLIHYMRQCIEYIKWKIHFRLRRK